MSKKAIVLISPFVIIITNFLFGFGFKELLGKWSFIPMILACWILWLILILKYGGKSSLKVWLQTPKENSILWGIFAIIIGTIPLPLFIFHH